jgi:hypothetical protein
MIQLRWNALSAGHHVLVHDETDPFRGLVPGRVTHVEHVDGSRVVTIRISPPGERTRTVQPRRLTVHLDSGESTERCWRCEVRDVPSPPTRRSRTAE